MKTLYTLLFIATSLLASCTAPEEVAINDLKETVQANTPKTEIAFPNQVGSWEKSYYHGVPLTYQKIQNEAVFEGDILLDQRAIANKPKKSQGSIRTYPSAIWPGSIVYYTIDPGLPNQSRVSNAISHWYSNTGIMFRPRTTQADYVTFKFGSGCSSYVGKVGGQQFLYLANACSTGNVIHEIGHAIGMWHEHSRTDRDTYITIHPENITSGYEYNFDKYADGLWDGYDYGALDFGSIMMYDSRSFSYTGAPTITKKDGSTYTIQRTGLSPADMATAGIMYAGDPNRSSIKEVKDQ